MSSAKLISRNLRDLIASTVRPPADDTLSIQSVGRLQNILAEVQLPLTLCEILELLNRVQLRNIDIISEFRFDENDYCRNIIFEDAHSLLVAITWLPGQRCPIHNHRGSACGVQVVDGTATETKYLRVNGRNATQYGHATQYEMGDVFGAEGSDDLHVLANRGKRAMKTLHLYSPPLKRENMQIFDEVPTLAANAGSHQ